MYYCHPNHPVVHICRPSPPEHSPRRRPSTSPCLWNILASRRRRNLWAQGLPYIVYMRFARIESVKTSRAVFGRARKDRWAPWEVSEASGAYLSFSWCLIFVESFSFSLPEKDLELFAYKGSPSPSIMTTDRLSSPVLGSPLKSFFRCLGHCLDASSPHSA